MGIFDIIRIPIGYLIQGCYALIPNYAIALLLFTLVMKIVLFPLGIKQQKNMVKQASLRPKEMAIRKKYAGRTDKATQQKMSEEVMKMYQDEKFSPFGGCLPLIVQMVILFALYAVIQNPLRYINHFDNDHINSIAVKMASMYKNDELITDGVSDNVVDKIAKMSEKITDENSSVTNTLTGIEIANLLSANGVEKFSSYIPEGFTDDDLPNFKIFGGKLDLSQTPSMKQANILLVIPVLTFVVYFVSMKVTRKMTYQAPTAGTDATMSMKMMDFAMPLMSVFISFGVPALLGLYWIYQSLFSMLQQLVLKLMFPIPEFDESIYQAAEKEMNSGMKLNRTAVKKAEAQGKIAMHRIDLEPEEVEEIKDSGDKKDEGDKKDDSFDYSERDEADKESIVPPAPLKGSGNNKKKKK